MHTFDKSRLDKRAADVASQACNLFQSRFREKPEVVGISPGRINLMGEHIDYNGGFVLPAAVPYYTAVAGRRIKNRAVKIVSDAFTWPYETTIDTQDPLGLYGDYVLGVAREIGIDFGFEATIASTIPLESGMSSSAALLCAAFRALELLVSQVPMVCVEAAHLCRKAENQFVGVPCGIMDQLTVCCGLSNKALLIDCSAASYTPVNINLSDVEWLLIVTGIKRKVSARFYKNLVQTSGKALRRLSRTLQVDVGSLRMLSKQQLTNALESAVFADKESCLVVHFLEENKRVLEFRRALEQGDSKKAGVLLLQSHWSLSSNCNVSLPEVDLFVDRCQAAPGLLGMRIMGAGLGGSLLALIDSNSMEDTLQIMIHAAKEAFPRNFRFLRIPYFCKGAVGWKT